MDLVSESQELLRNIELLNSDSDVCHRNSVVNRVCERGTKCCTVYHSDPLVNSLVISEKIDSCASILINNSSPSPQVLQAGINSCDNINWENDSTESIVKTIYQATIRALVRELRDRSEIKTYAVDK